MGKSRRKVTDRFNSREGEKKFRNPPLVYPPGVQSLYFAAHDGVSQSDQSTTTFVLCVLFNSPQVYAQATHKDSSHNGCKRHPHVNVWTIRNYALQALPTRAGQQKTKSLKPSSELNQRDRPSDCPVAIDRAEREISLLREYRTRLIADVVTGKLDVREAAASLPDEADEPEHARRSAVDAELTMRMRDDDLERGPRGGRGVTASGAAEDLPHHPCGPSAVASSRTAGSGVGRSDDRRGGRGTTIGMSRHQAAARRGLPVSCHSGHDGRRLRALLLLSAVDHAVRDLIAQPPGADLSGRSRTHRSPGGGSARSRRLGRREGRRWAFTLSNAGARYAQFRSPSHDWTRSTGMPSATGLRPTEVKEGKQAEFLVDEFFPWHLVERIGVHSRLPEQVVDGAPARPRPSASGRNPPGLVLLSGRRRR